MYGGYNPQQQGQSQQGFMGYDNSQPSAMNGPMNWGGWFQPSVSAMQNPYDYLSAYGTGASNSSSSSGVPTTTFTNNTTQNFTLPSTTSTSGTSSGFVPTTTANPAQTAAPAATPAATPTTGAAATGAQASNANTYTGAGGGPVASPFGANTPVQTGQGFGNSMLNPNNGINAFMLKYGSF